MSDHARGEITNGIWLCVNCHRLVDRDGHRFPPALLFAWREEHERYVTSALGNSSDRIRFDVAKAELAPFADYSPMVRRIVADKPKGWEWRLTAELMRFLNEPVFRRLDDLENGLYTRNLQHVSAGEAPTWVRSRFAEMSRLVTPLPKLIDRLNASWGPPGAPGDALEIDHCCRLIQDALEEIVKHEERLVFVEVPQEYEKVRSLLKDRLGSQARYFKEYPAALDGVLAMIDTDHGGTRDAPLVVEKVITFQFPEKWSREMTRELRRLGLSPTLGNQFASNMLSIITAIVIMWFAIAAFI